MGAETDVAMNSTRIRSIGTPATARLRIVQFNQIRQHLSLHGAFLFVLLEPYSELTISAMVSGISANSVRGLAADYCESNSW